jgi:hypothetical protein
MENRIAELKHDLGADGFCLKEFFATEAAFQAVLLLFNLLSEFQRAAGLPSTANRPRCVPKCSPVARHPRAGPAAAWSCTCRKVGVDCKHATPCSTKS